jgi:hypothetical protein
MTRDGDCPGDYQESCDGLKSGGRWKGERPSTSVVSGPRRACFRRSTSGVKAGMTRLFPTPVKVVP